MYNCVIITQNKQLKNECEWIISAVGEINYHHLISFDEIDFENSFQNCLFFVVSEINPYILLKMQTLLRKMPGVSFILYNHTLSLSGLKEIGDLSEIKIIIGENREQIFFEVLQKLKKNYWRSIPLDRFNIDLNRLSPHIRKALKFIESAEIHQCNTHAIAAHLHINPCYFSQKFKREIGYSFRAFMQQVLNYYEDFIFSQAHLPATNISQLLGYSELSSFSRSFKNRKGVSPTQYRKMVKA